MKIGIYIDSKGLGGIETHILQLILGLIENTDYEIDLLFWKNYGAQNNEQHPLLTKLGSADTRIAERCRFININGSIVSLYHYFSSPVSLIHTHGYKAGITARIIGALTKTPVVSTYHNGDPGTGKLKFYNALDRVTSFLSLNIAVNAMIAKPLKRCSIISNFVNPMDKRCLHEELDSRKSIAFVGRLSHEKGPDIFSEITQGLNHPIAIYGDGPMMAELKKDYPHVEYKGMCDMEQHWKDIRVVVMPSRFEGLPLAALEAMARGIPVIASTAGALPELIADCKIGKAISLEKTAEFQQAINNIMRQQNNDYSAQGEKLIAYINESFSRSKNIPKIISQYHLALKLTHTR
jgi:glycosyltransferase involved in cell wall biosynthesis